MIDLGLSDDQLIMLEGATSLLNEHAPISGLQRPGRSKELQQGLAAWGWFGVGLSERRGGLGLGVSEETLLAFEAGRFLLPPSVLATVLAARLCDDRSLQGLLSGELRAALALHDGENALAFERDGAALLVVFDADEIWLAPDDAPRGQSVAGFDETIPTEKGGLTNSARLAGEPAMHGRLLVAAMLAGIARASCDLAVEYAKVREQFGQPIGAFQAIKHICADMGLRAYAAEAQVKMAAAMMADVPGMAAPDVAAAALTALRAARTNASDAIQVHGGIGFTAECAAHLYLKRSHVLGAVLGGTEKSSSLVLDPPKGGRS